MTRDELKNSSLESLKEYKNIAIQAATGSGKSYVSLYCINSLNIPEESVLIVVAERSHIKNWIDEISKWNFPYTKVTIICYASLKKYYNKEWKAVIFDEAHHLSSTIRLELFSHITCDYKIFLSATLKQSLIDSLSDYCGFIKSLKLGLQEAIDSDILPEPKIVLIPLELDATHYTETIVEEWGLKYKRIKLACNYAQRWTYKRQKKVIPNATLTISCTPKQKYEYITEQFDYWKRTYLSSRNEAVKNKWLQAGSERKRYLGSLKTTVAYNLLKSLKGKKRFICFCSSIVQAEALGNSSAVHSKNKNSFKIINSFNNKEINNIYAVGMLQEGVNLYDIEAGVIIQLDGEERAFIQKFGRTLRAESPTQYILYFKGTRDEEYLANALENVDKKYIKTLNINEIHNR